MSRRHEGRVVVVTGAAAGIGRATAERFAREGATVVALDVVEFPEDLASALSSDAAAPLLRSVDVSQAEAVDGLFGEVADTYGRLDAVINNAGIVRDAQLIKWKDGVLQSRMTEDQFDAVIGVNLKGVFLVTRAAVPLMIQTGGGAILNASSVVALNGNFGQTNYAAAKGGVITMTRSWARELGRHRIRVNAIAPGFIQTDMLEGIPQKFRERLAAMTPLGRLGAPDEVAAAYSWLASDEAGFVTGAVLSVDGGVVLGT